MKSMVKLLRKHPIIGIILGIVIGSVSVVIAESIQSNEVLYDNSNSSSNKENVQDALDNLYNIVDTVGSCHALIASNTTGLSTELVGGIYRYQGIQNANNNVNNYICFGTTNKLTCTGDTDKYMYRIIGINTSGQMKLIKKEALNTAYKWNSSVGSDWAHSDLFAGLNDSYFLTNTTYIPDSTWSNRIETVNWLYGNVDNANKTALEMYNIESNLSSSIYAKIGLMYLYDYYYGLPSGNNCYNSSVGPTCTTSWIYYANNDSSTPTNNEWTISKDSYNLPWVIIHAGTAANLSVGMTEVRSVRPVFFLTSNQIIASGSGTITDPYMLSS